MPFGSTDQVGLLDRSLRHVYRNGTMEDDAGLVRAHIKVTGTVQGVGYRYWAARNAGSLSLGGCVWNLPDGSVEAVFCGASDAVREMIGRCETGPSFSYVQGLQVLHLETVAECPDVFRILR
jgi:acylphosphatase